jgi:hypothetical protein
MMVLALDTATRCGFAFGETGCATPEFGARDFSGQGGNGEVIGKFRQWLNQRCYQLKPGIVVFEAPYIPVFQKPKPGGPPPMNALTLRRLIGLTETVCAVCWELRIECREATTGEISKFFTGVFRHAGGRDAKKAATIAMCTAWGWDVEGSDDAADALALWAMAEAIVDPRAHQQRGGEGALFLRAATQRAAKENAPRRQPRSAQTMPPDEGNSSKWPTTLL